MALAEETLKAQLLALFGKMKNAPMGEEEYAGELAKIINNHVKTATVTVDPGIAVSTPVGPGATSAPGTGSLS
jgi:hypothetical protein